MVREIRHKSVLAKIYPTQNGELFNAFLNKALHSAEQF